MKKLIALTAIAASLAGSSAFGQGYFQFTSGKSQVYDGSGTAAALDTAIDVAFYWGAAATTPAVDALATQSSKTGNNSTTAIQAGYTAATAWTAILNDANFTLAVNSGTSAAVVTPTSSTGAISYSGGGSFGVTGTSPGTTYTIYEVSWLAADGATPAAAAADGSPIGWSAPLQYGAVISIGTPQSMAGGAFASFGTFSPVVVPEPTTLALAGLSGASLLLFRRKK
jgi:hypothetical protein